nr:hypothetical protein Q903MT_gene1566 [Picea sitchensis]
MGYYPRGRTEVSKWNEAFLSPTSFHPYALSLAHPEVLDTYHSGKPSVANLMFPCALSVRSAFTLLRVSHYHSKANTNRNQYTPKLRHPVTWFVSSGPSHPVRERLIRSSRRFPYGYLFTTSV